MTTRVALRGTFLLTSLGLLLSCWSCSGDPRQESDPQPTVQEAIQETMAEARAAIDELGLTEATMHRIQAALGSLAQVPGLKEYGEVGEVHGGGVASAVLSSDGQHGLTLILARFRPGETTPVHDHGTWAVAHVVEGRDRYIQWERMDDGVDPQHAELRVKFEKVLGPGDSIYWFEPPHDIHSQQAMGDFAWELLLFGRNPLQGTLHYFDIETGRVEERKPQ